MTCKSNTDNRPLADRFPPGEGYQIRDGRAARVDKNDVEGDCPIHGFVEISPGRWAYCIWGDDGKALATDGTEFLDLMPKRREV